MRSAICTKAGPVPGVVKWHSGNISEVQWEYSLPIRCPRCGQHWCAHRTEDHATVATEVCEG
jgi:hypothetical protein